MTPFTGIMLLRSAARDVESLLSDHVCRDWIGLPGFGRLTMKQSGLREPMPLWVWLTLGLLILGAVVYFTGYLVVEDILRLFYRHQPD
jgi:hypothetical protein